MTRAAFATLLSHWRRHPLQLFTLIAGLALATGLWSAVQAINAEARASYAEAETQLTAGQHDLIVARDGAISVDQYVTLRRAGWLVSPVLEGEVEWDGVEMTLLGIDPLTSPLSQRLATAEGEAGLDPLAARRTVFTSRETADRIRIADDHPPVVVNDDIAPGTAIADIGLAERLLDRPEVISHLVVLSDQPRTRPLLESAAPGLIRVEAGAAGDSERLTRSFHLNLTALGLLSFAVGLFIVQGTVGLAFEQRRGMFRTLRAIGLPVRRLIWIALAEILGLALVGGALGIILGYAIATALVPDVAATLRGLYGAEMSTGLSLRPSWIAAGLGMAVLGTLLAAAHSLWRLRRVPILATAHAEAATRANVTTLRLQLAIGVASLILAWTVIGLFDGLVAGFVFVAGLLIGAALLLSPVLAGVLGVGSRLARGPIAQWVWADTREQLSGLSLALMALLLALAANIGVGTMVSSFKLTFTGWLDQRLVSELYVTAETDAQGQAVQDWLEPRVDAVLPIRHADTRIAGRPAEIYGVVVDHETYRRHWPLLKSAPEVWDRVAAGQGALINEQFARRADLNPGDTVTLAPDWRLPVVGVYSDYGNPTWQAMVSLDALLERFPGIPARQFGIRVDPDRVEGVAAELRDRFDLPARSVIDQAAVKAHSLAIFDKTFLVTGALNVLTLGVAGFAILTSLLTLWTMRLPQLAPLWALGLTRTRLAALELLRSIGLAGLTFVLAIPLGLVLAWALLAIINVEAFGWRLPMFLFPGDWLVLGALALLAAALAALLPAWRLRRMPPSELLKVFADER